MALKPCQECGQAVSTQAVSCPHCGSPQPAATTGHVLSTTGQPKPKSRGVLKGCGITVAITVALLFLVLLFSSSEDGLSGAESKVVSNSEWDASVSQVEAWLKEKLKDPGSYDPVEWSEVRQKSSAELGVVYVVRHKYRAKNSFGGYAISDDIFVLDSRGVIVLTSTFEEWPETQKLYGIY